ncbi:hypothetical protein BN341_3770 [Helicobacter heilmannii ASB1.4]|uniref:Uncharacterized protein n=1 Tax=Helicobacter heilmannii TaxID=35817 RepID=A0A0K2YAV1_HELHE|nr:hypothetical protein BN341_3770 [Helicobacter heilmannii ASB1.4]CRI34120.1 hypothetical protein HHE01_09660 [Helicobacter heilmannii]
MACLKSVDKQYSEIVCTCKLFTSEQIGFVPILECMTTQHTSTCNTTPKLALYIGPGWGKSL